MVEQHERSAPSADDRRRGQRTPPAISRKEMAAFSKDVRELLRGLKAGFRVERTGGGHYRLRDRHGSLVKASDGKNLTIVTDPSPGVVRALREELTAARVLRGTEAREIPNAIAKERATKLKAAQEERNARRVVEARQLRERLDAALSVVGGIDLPQRAGDLGWAGVVVAREQGKQMTPDLLTQNARGLIEHRWVETRYQEVWTALAERLERAPEPGGLWYSLIREARGLPGDVVELHQARDAVADEWPFRVELLHLDQLFADDSYQRPVGWEFVRREAARFDPALVGTIDVAQRAPTRYAILDGQQRREIVRLVGKTTIYTSIYEGLDLASEARFFLHKNDKHKNVHPYYKFRARVAAHDGEAMEIERLLKRYGYKLGLGAPRGGQEDQISAVAALEKAYRRAQNGGPPALDATLRTLKTAVFGREYATAALLIRGLSLIFAETNADEQRVVEIVADIGPTLLIGRASDIARNSATINKEQAVAQVVEAEYNKRGGRGERLKWIAA